MTFWVTALILETESRNLGTHLSSVMRQLLATAVGELPVPEASSPTAHMLRVS